MKNNLVVIVCYFCLIIPRYGFAQAKLPLCTTLADIKAHDGQRVQVLGELARHYKLPHHPSILLLENNEWIFLGNDSLYQQRLTDKYYVTFALVEGTIYATNSQFRLANFNNTPLPRIFFMNSSLPPPAKAPQKIIRAQPFFKKTDQISLIPDCSNKTDISQNLGRWVTLYGWLSPKNATTTTFRSSKKNAVFSFDMPTKTTQLRKKARMGYIIARFDQTTSPPVAILRQQVLPRCQTKRQIKKHRGKIVALKGWIRGQGYIIKKRRVFLYIYSLPTHLTSKKHEKRINLITRIYQYGDPEFFEMPMYFSRYYFGQAGYLISSWWCDK